MLVYNINNIVQVHICISLLFQEPAPIQPSQFTARSKLLFSGGDKNLRGTLLGRNFSRWGEGMNRFLASGGTPILPAVEILVWVQHLFVHLFTYTYLFSLDISNLLLACDKDNKLMHYYRIFLKQSLDQTYLQTFKTYIRSYQSIFKNYLYEKILP